MDRIQNDSFNKSLLPRERVYQTVVEQREAGRDRLMEGIYKARR
jgi:hypothetical protein